MDVDILRNKLTFRQAADYLTQPIALDYLRYLQTTDIPDYSDDDVTDISDAFSEFKTEDLRILTLYDLRKKMKKFGNKYKFKDIFTEDYKRVFDEVANEIQVSPDSVSDEINSIISSFYNNYSPRDLNPELEDSIKRVFDTEECKLSPRSESTDSSPNLLRRRVSDIYFDDMDMLSHLYKLFETNEDGMHITYPGYNAFEQKKKHHLQMDLVPWNTMQKSIKKCNEWFEKYQDYV